MMEIKRKTLKIIIPLFLVLPIVLIIYNPQKDPYKFEGNTIHYSDKRGKPDFNILLEVENETFSIYKVNFPSKNFLDQETKIYGLLFKPKSNKDVPALVYLPGGGVKKEGLTELASRIVELGYAVLVIDQRGIGETGGVYLNFEQDYQVVLQGKEPIQHLSVYDGLRTYDVLREIEGIDEENIGIIGESMGGRYAMIASSIDKRLKGVIVISSSGFHIDENPLQEGNNYLVSVDPDHYVSRISPNKLMMLQGDSDTVTHLEDAEKTFSIAREPKRFFVAEGCGHGFCEEMWDELVENLRILFKK